MDRYLRNVIVTICDQPGMTQVQLAKELGVARRTVHRWYHGVSPPQKRYVKQIEEVAERLDVSVDHQEKADYQERTERAARFRGMRKLLDKAEELGLEVEMRILGKPAEACDYCGGNPDEGWYTKCCGSS